MVLGLGVRRTGRIKCAKVTVKKNKLTAVFSGQGGSANQSSIIEVK